MPFAALDRPALGLSLLKGALLRAGHGCDVLYPNLAFADTIGREPYDWMAIAKAALVMVGDAVFRQALLRDADDDRLRYLLAVDWGLEPEIVDAVLAAAREVPAFLRRLLDDVEWPAYRLVGFASSCAQNTAALAFARALKERHPDIMTVFGGPNWDGDMGRAYFDRYRFVDAVCISEADRSLPALTACLARGALDEVAGVKGVLFRTGHHVVDTGPPELVHDLDTLAVPDHDDYFTWLQASGQRGSPAMIGVEASRGCWWAERGPCLFCGQNGTSRRYRRKSPARVVTELREAAARPECTGVDVVDNVVSQRFLGEVVPQLVGQPLGVPLFLEARPELSRGEVAQLARIEGSIQVGIETLNDHVLDLMHKGSTALRNVRLLRWCKTEGLEVAWNLLFGFPGETHEDYASLIESIPALVHLPPPAGCGRLTLDRFSPYFERQARHGFRDVRPRRRYAQVHGTDEEVAAGFAYEFSYLVDDDLLTAAYVRRLSTEVGRWQKADEADLRLECDAGRQTVRDTRNSTDEPVTEVDELDVLLLALCDDGVDEVALRRHAAAALHLRQDLVVERVRRLEERRWVMRLSGKVLGLVLGVPAASRTSADVAPVAGTFE